MLSPEVWNFQSPKHQSFTSGSAETFSKVFSDIEKHFFNHSVTIVLPDTVLVSEDLNTALTTDSVYYKIEALSVYRFLSKDFIEAFIKTGKLSALSVDTHIDTEDCVAVTPSGHLVLNLLRQTYQTLGLEGSQSAFSTERYVVQIDLKQDSFTPGKKNYERALKCLSLFVDLQMDFLIAWEPPENTQDKGQVCPSSVAAYFSALGYEVSSCSPQVTSSRQYDVRLPPSDTDVPELLEWLGAVAVGVDMSREDAEGRYLSKYSGPLEASRTSQVAILKYFGFFTTKQIEKLFKIFRGYVEKRKDLPLAALHVQGFSDSPISWGLREHTFHSDGDNYYTVVLWPDNTFLLSRTHSFAHKMKPKIV